jgi:hypothetical protein
MESVDLSWYRSCTLSCLDSTDPPRCDISFNPGKQTASPLSQLGSRAIDQLLNTQVLRALLDEDCVAKLEGFVTGMGERELHERTYALLGQAYFSNVMYCQMDDVALAVSKDIGETENIIAIMRAYHQKLVRLVSTFESWSDLEDHDSDADEEEYRLSWDQASSDNEIEEPDDR